ncbi:hypothetical protein HHI36_016633 [Cryptolaemus montrouzieri]|uniref:Uncharacterized protein n=1 Tax=Cryptolaemus montrouzieri TaxID=559131 RepID=A0ABD2NKP9_9CUCU
MLDLFLTNDPALLCILQLSAPLGRSYHSVITANLQFSKIHHTELPSKMHIFIDFNSLNSYLHGIDWDIVLDPEDFETAWNSFSSTLTAAVSDHSRHRQIKEVATKP